MGSENNSEFTTLHVRIVVTTISCALYVCALGVMMTLSIFRFNFSFPLFTVTPSSRYNDVNYTVCCVILSTDCDVGGDSIHE